MFKLTKTVVALGTALIAASASAAPIQLISNGGFETGTLAGWTVTDLAGGTGTWGIDDNNGTTPISAQATVGPATGSFYAVSDQTGPGTHILEQSFIVPVGATSVVLSFDMFMNDWDTGPIVDPAGLTHLTGANQHARVDIMAALAGAFSTAAIDIVSTLVAPTVDAGADPNGYTAYLFDITGLVSSGGTYKLRFAEVDNQLFFNQGVDNVSIIAQVPEPATLALFGLGLAGLVLSKRRAKA